MTDADSTGEAIVQRAQGLKDASSERLRAYPNVTGVGVGFKEVAGARTDIVAIRVYVAPKLPRTQLADEDVLPEEIEGVPVDVIEARFQVHGGPSAIADHRTRHNPLIGGISIGNLELGGSGTLGGSVFDGITGEDMILSNWHVLCGRADCAVGESIIQPGSGGGDTGEAEDTVAWLHRTALTGEVDAAIGRLSGQRFLLRELLEIGPIEGTTDPVLGSMVRKSGRTSGVTTAAINDVSADVDVDGYPDGTRTFHRQLIIENSNPSLPGDSGSLWINDSNQVVGLNFAGSSGRAVANRIQSVLQALNINFDSGITMHAFVAATNAVLN